MAALERDFQSELIKKLRTMFPNIIILKNDPNYLQGVPDLTLLWEDRWATLEVKKGYFYKAGPNQEYYVNLMDQMSFSAFIYPENEEAILDELQRSFATRR